MPISLIRLPKRVLLFIGSYLPRSALFDLVLCSRPAYTFFSHFLYSTLELYQAHGCEIAAVIETLINKSFLAHSVLQIHAEHWEVDHKNLAQKFGHQPWWALSDEDSEEEDTSCYDWLPINNLGRYVWRASCSEDEAQQWLRDLRSHNADACMGLLLTLVPNLRKLKIRYPRSSIYVPWVIERAANPHYNFLPVLSWVFAAGPLHGCFSLEFAQVEPFFKLPAMRNVHFHRMKSDSKFSNGMRTSRVTHIQVSSSAWRFHMRDIVRSCTNLVSLKYEHWGGCRSSNRIGFYTGSFYNSIYPARRTLENLWLDFGPRFKTAGRKPFPPLVEFTSLKVLHLPSYYLVGINEATGKIPRGYLLSKIVPPSLEVLEVSRVNRKIVQQMAHILRQHIVEMLEITPRLSRIGLEGRLAPPDLGFLDPDNPHPPLRKGRPVELPRDVYLNTARLQRACALARIHFDIHDMRERAFLNFEECPFIDRNMNDRPLSSDSESELQDPYPVGSDDSVLALPLDPD